MTYKRFREVRRGFIDGALGNEQTNEITVNMFGGTGLGLEFPHQGPILMEVMLLAILPSTSTGGGCLIKRAVYTKIAGGGGMIVTEEGDHNDTLSFFVSGHNTTGERNRWRNPGQTTPFPPGITTAINDLQPTPASASGMYPLTALDFAYTYPDAIINYKMWPGTPNSTKVHYQITMEAFIDNMD